MEQRKIFQNIKINHFKLNAKTKNGIVKNLIFINKKEHNNSMAEEVIEKTVHILRNSNLNSNKY